MRRTRAQSSLNNLKPPGDRRFKASMQTSTRPSVPNEGFAVVQANREFDLWLQRELGRMHGDVLHEPVPEKLLRILEDGAITRD